MSRLQTRLAPNDRAYSGEELRPHFLLREFGLKGSAIGAFIGPCRVETEHLVDWEDRLANDRIEAARMVHFIGEFFGYSLREGVILQRLFMAMALEGINGSPGIGGRHLWREGDDLYFGESGSARKLSVSIVTASPVSQLLHVGINVDPAGAPVPAIGLAELGIAPEEFAKASLNRFADELESMEWACAKVRPVI